MDCYTRKYQVLWLGVKGNYILLLENTHQQIYTTSKLKRRRNIVQNGIPQKFKINEVRRVSIWQVLYQRPALSWKFSAPNAQEGSSPTVKVWFKWYRWPVCVATAMHSTKIFIFWSWLTTLRCCCKCCQSSLTRIQHWHRCQVILEHQ